MVTYSGCVGDDQHQCADKIGEELVSIDCLIRLRSCIWLISCSKEAGDGNFAKGVRMALSMRYCCWPQSLYTRTCMMTTCSFSNCCCTKGAASSSLMVALAEVTNALRTLLHKSSCFAVSHGCTGKGDSVLNFYTRTGRVYV